MPKYKDGTEINPGHVVKGRPVDCEQPVPAIGQVIGTIYKIGDEGKDSDPDVTIKVDRYLIAAPDGIRASFEGGGSFATCKSSTLERLF